MTEQNEETTPEQTPEVQARLAEIRAKLAKTQEIPAIDEPVREPVSGKDVDWSEFDLDPNIAHLYPRAVGTPTEEGMQWSVVIDDYYVLRVPYSILAAEMANMVNGPERWVLQSAAIPAGAFSRRQAELAGHPKQFGPAGMVTLQRKVRLGLPTPLMLKTEADDAPTQNSDAELKDAEDAALNWIEKEGQAQAGAPANDADTPSVTPINAVTRTLGVAEGSNSQEIVGDRVLPGARTAASEAVNG